MPFTKLKKNEGEEKKTKDVLICNSNVSHGLLNKIPFSYYAI